MKQHGLCLVIFIHFWTVSCLNAELYENGQVCPEPWAGSRLRWGIRHVEAGDAGGAPPHFGISVNPISTGGQIMTATLYWLVSPDFKTFLRPCWCCRHELELHVNFLIILRHGGSHAPRRARPAAHWPSLAINLGIVLTVDLPVLCWMYYIG